MPASPATRRSKRPEPRHVGRGDRHQSRLLLPTLCKAVWDSDEREEVRPHVNIGSGINGQAGQYGQVNYAAAKSGHPTASPRRWRRKVPAPASTVKAIAPGYFDTEMVQAVPGPTCCRRSVARIPVGTPRQGRRVARGVAFLVADEGASSPGSDAVHQRRPAHVLTPSLGKTPPRLRFAQPSYALARTGGLNFMARTCDSSRR